MLINSMPIFQPRDRVHCFNLDLILIGPTLLYFCLHEIGMKNNKKIIRLDAYMGPFQVEFSFRKRG